MSAPVYHRISTSEQKALYKRIVERSHRKPGEANPVIVFDLDGTLMDNRPRTQTILHELAAELKKEAHQAAEVLGSTKIESIAYMLTETLRLIGVDHPELVARAEEHWRQRFFTDEYLKYDIAIPGTVELAKACYEAGATLVYFTGRDLPLMSLGSFGSLRDLGFPIGVVGTELVCKPDAKIPDEKFKKEEGPKLARIGRVIATFDNEPGNCNAFQAMFPEADNVFVATQHLPGAPPLDAKVHVVPDLVM
jgi:hypothetical protein